MLNIGKKYDKLKDSFGRPPSGAYHTGDMYSIKRYYEHMSGFDDEDVYSVDDITWNDLSMEKVFKRINCTCSTPGEQMLYNMLRYPALDSTEYEKRKRLADIMGNDGELRFKLQKLLFSLGKKSEANTVDIFSPKRRSPLLLIVSIGIILLMLSFAVGMFINTAFALPFVITLTGAIIFHSIVLTKLQNDIKTVSYTASMIYTCKKMKKLLKGHDLGFEKGFKACSKLSKIGKYGMVLNMSSTEMMMMVNSVLMTDIIAYELIKNKLGRYHNEIFAVHELIGMVDASIAIASYRASVPCFCEPEIDFDESARPYIDAREMIHPLVEDCVRNDITLDGRSMLLTGSNASGKSTYIKTAVINALLAQSMATALCSSYRAVSFNIYTSMALKDNLTGGESYFIAEIKSLKRVFDAADRGERVLCAVDEILRGTNMIERIASSSELLRAIVKKGALCVAATHDTELCRILAGEYVMCHFEEQISQGRMLFDYTIKDGPSNTQNAIKLLELLSFNRSVVKRAEENAEFYRVNGRWTDG